ncbi:CinA family protein [Deferrisoma camini]|uniref:CinA family protein n=1 Tax=Deferrisoma camini TaxID=1035120 RepID=UPI00046D9192|nr:CinA family protein [Deferrisoma camini]
MPSDLPEVRLGRFLSAGGGPLAVVESCTGGLIAHRITRVAGSSAYFDRGLVVYSNRAKTELLGVPADLLELQGAVSEACARAMLEGLFARSPARIGAAVTGIAGPTGGSPEKPVGTVWVAWGRPGRIRAERLSLGGTRTQIQERAADEVLERLAAEAKVSWSASA